MMRHLIVLVSLVLSAVPAFAEWRYVSEDAVTGQTVYVDPDSIHRHGDMAEMWTLYDYQTAQPAAGEVFLSSKIQNEYNCREEMRRMVSITEFAGHMGTGKVVHKGSSLFTAAKWVPARAGLGERLLKVACGKK